MNLIALIFLLGPGIVYMAVRLLNWSVDRFGEDRTARVAVITVWLGLTAAAVLA